MSDETLYGPPRISRGRRRRKHTVPKGGITDSWIEHRMQRPDPRYTKAKSWRYYDTLQRGLQLVVAASAGGSVTLFVLIYNEFGKKLPLKKLGKWPAMQVEGDDGAKAKAWAYFQNPQKSLAARKAGTLDEVFDKFVFKHVERNKLLTETAIKYRYEKLIQPRLGRVPIYAITRKQVSELLDDIENDNGPAQADKVLNILLKLFKWYATTDGDFNSPLVPGMGRYVYEPRERALSDDELRALWAVDSVMADFARFSILSGQRKAKVLELRFEHIVNGTWFILSDSRRRKGTGEELILPAMALAIIERQRTPQIQPRDLVFAMSESTLTRRKKELDAVLQFAAKARTHDLRRTSKSLMSRAGVLPHISELVLGHKQKGLMAVYDQHQFTLERGQALQALADLIKKIVGLNVEYPPQYAQKRA
jgi:integrase